MWRCTKDSKCNVGVSFLVKNPSSRSPDSHSSRFCLGWWDTPKSHSSNHLAQGTFSHFPALASFCITQTLISRCGITPCRGQLLRKAVGVALSNWGKPPLILCSELGIFLPHLLSLEKQCEITQKTRVACSNEEIAALWSASYQQTHITSSIKVFFSLIV